MVTLVSARLTALWLAACVCAGLGGCQVSPPAAHSAARHGIVRARTSERALEVARLLDALQPAVIRIVPDTRSRPIEVWVQDEPALYAFPPSAYSDADGFWAEGADRIHLRDRCDSLPRTLAHELVHASLGPSWRMLPGTLEEGLCDVVAARLCPEAAPRLRAGRLSSAAFATGGLLIEVELTVPVEDRAPGFEIEGSARLRLEGDPPVRVDPLRVFDLKAGLSSTDLTSEAKKAFYGLAFLVVERIVERAGFEGLHELCMQTAQRGGREVPIERLLELADLGAEPETWRQAIREGLGAPELAELVRAHPEFLVQTLAHFLEPYSGTEQDLSILETLTVRLSVAGTSREGMVVPGLGNLRERLAGCLQTGSPATGH